MKSRLILLIAITVTSCFIFSFYTAQEAFPIAENIQPLVEDFVIEKILDGEGEYLSITRDNRGRFIISPRYGEVIRVEVVDQKTIVDTLDLGVQDCQGMLFALDHLYMMGTGPEDIRGVYRCPINQDEFEDPILMKEFPKNGDHSGHTIALGPDSLLYFLSGNENRVPSGSDIEYINSDWHIDHPMMLRSMYGGNQKPPGGFVLRTDPEGKEWTLYAQGLRNPYDMCFNSEGELFTFDSDMEWDFNLPWYRPIRVNHLVSGGDYAWRPYNAKRFDSYPDVWPAVVDLGRGSPTATCFGTNTNFPSKYQQALFLGDWSYGKIYALHLQEDGSSYAGDYEVFATGKPLNITDMIAGLDGHLYFVTGGNGTDTGLFRIRYTGKGPTQPFKSHDNPLRALRHQLEMYHTAKDTSGLKIALAHINHSDQFVRKAARIILERNDPTIWALHKDITMDVPGKMEFLAALIRSDSTGQYLTNLLDMFKSITFMDLNPDQQAGFARLIALTILRNESMETEMLKNFRRLILPFYPSQYPTVNKEMSRSLALINRSSPENAGFIPITLNLLENSEDQKMIIHYLEVLRQVPEPWSIKERLAYRYWSDYAIKYWSGGSLFNYFLKAIRADFEENLAESTREEIDRLEPKPLNANYSGPFVPKSTVKRSASTPNPFINNWQFEDLEYSLELVNSPRSSRERNLQRGYQMLEQGQCYTCHYILNRGGSFGPELTLASNSFGVEELAKTIISPSAAINGRFQATEFKLKENAFIRGRVVNESETHYVVQLDWFGNVIEEVPKESIISTQPSSISDMPPGLINTMRRGEILDMLFFISELPGKQEDPFELDIFYSSKFNEIGDTAFIEILDYAKTGGIYVSINEADFRPYEGPFNVTSNSTITAYKEYADSVTAKKSQTIHFYDSDQNGVLYKMYFNPSNRFDVEGMTPDVQDTTYGFDFAAISQDRDHFLTEFSGYLEITEPGEYLFYAHFNDAIQFFIDDQPIVINTESDWGGQGMRCIELEAGRVPFKILLFDLLGTEYVDIEYEGAGTKRQPIMASKLFLNEN